MITTDPPEDTTAVRHRAEADTEAGPVLVTALDVDGERFVCVELPDEPLTRGGATNVASLLLQAATLT